MSRPVERRHLSAGPVVVVVTAMVAALLLTPSAEAAERSGRVTGKIATTGDRSAVSGARVWAYRKVKAHTWSRSKRAAITTRSGRFTFGRLPAGKYRFLVGSTATARAGWVGAGSDWRYVRSAKTLYRPGGATLVVEGGRTVTAPRTRLSAVGGLKTTFVDTKGLHPLAEVRYRLGRDGRSGPWITRRTSRTGAGSVLTLAELEAGTHTLGFRTLGGSTWHRTAVTTTAPGSRAVTLTLPAEIKAHGGRTAPRIKRGSSSAAAPAIPGDILTASGTSSFNYPSSALAFSYQWLRDGVALPGATSTDYAVTAADHAHKLTARIVASRPGYTSASTTTFAVGVARTSTTTSLSLSRSTAAYGTTDQVVATVKVTAADGGPVPGTVILDQACEVMDFGDNEGCLGAWGQRLAIGTDGELRIRLPRYLARVPRLRARYVPPTASGPLRSSALAPFLITPRQSRTTLTLADRRVRVGARPKAVVDIDVAGGYRREHLVGYLVVRADGKRLKIGSYDMRRPHRIKVTLPRLGRGTYKVTATFRPRPATGRWVDSAARASTSKAVRLRVR